jgi:hypothetical protein
MAPRCEVREPHSGDAALSSNCIQWLARPFRAFSALIETLWRWGWARPWPFGVPLGSERERSRSWIRRSEYWFCAERWRLNAFATSFADSIYHEGHQRTRQSYGGHHVKIVRSYNTSHSIIVARKLHILRIGGIPP